MRISDWSSDVCSSDLRPLGVEDNGMGNVLRHDAERLRILLERHHLHTGSARARALLDDWEETLRRFVKVMPKDYRRALQDIEAERSAERRVGQEWVSTCGSLWWPYN